MKTSMNTDVWFGRSALKTTTKPSETFSPLDSLNLSSSCQTDRDTPSAAFTLHLPDWSRADASTSNTVCLGYARVGCCATVNNWPVGLGQPYPTDPVQNTQKHPQITDKMDAAPRSHRAGDGREKTSLVFVVFVLFPHCGWRRTHAGVESRASDWSQSCPTKTRHLCFDVSCKKWNVELKLDFKKNKK